MSVISLWFYYVYLTQSEPVLKAWLIHFPGNICCENSQGRNIWLQITDTGKHDFIPQKPRNS